MYLMCTLFANLNVLSIWGPIWFTWGPHPYFIFIWSNVVGWDTRIIICKILCLIEYNRSFGSPSTVYCRWTRKRSPGHPPCAQCAQFSLQCHTRNTEHNSTWYWEYSTQYVLWEYLTCQSSRYLTCQSLGVLSIVPNVTIVGNTIKGTLLVSALGYRQGYLACQYLGYLTRQSFCNQGYLNCQFPNLQ